MKKIMLILCFVISFVILYGNNNKVNAEGFLYQDDVEIYSIYDEDFNLLFQKDVVELGDAYMSEEYKYYEVVYINEDNKTGIAKFVREVPKPNVDISFAPKPIKIENRVIGMYMTHNDESYLPSDGVDSVYGNGGIKDVALAFKKALEKNFIDVHFDDTLHIPHDTSAYSRSRKTAESLNSKYKPDAIFDIHRDATSRKFYVSEVNGKERGRVRIVLGKSNPYLKINEEFALYVVAVANELYPWLITDIYYGSGHYNQSLSGKALLFEMGTYLLEKEIVIDSMDELAEVVTTALYNTTVNEESGELTINGVEDNKNTTVNDFIDKKETNKISVLAVSIVIVIMASISVSAIIMFIKNLKKQQNLIFKNNKKKDLQ